jgi:sortase (surface protein transpeptidase)
MAVMVFGAAATVLGVHGWATADHPIPARSPGPVALVAVPRGKIAAVPGPSGRVRVARPVRLVIPAIGVSTRLIHLGLTSAHTLQVPATTAVAGWYTGSPRPGAVGSSVIAGHVDSKFGPGIFFRLRLLHRGQRIYVVRADHSVAVFRITVVHIFRKNQFPSLAVYGPVPDAELRLITCGGLFDYATGSYLSNVVVYAVLSK